VPNSTLYVSEYDQTCGGLLADVIDKLCRIAGKGRHLAKKETLMLEAD